MDDAMHAAAPLSRHALRLIAGLLAACALAGAPRSVAANEVGPASREDLIKAAMVFNFMRFASWPPARFAGPDSPLRLCVRDDSYIADALAAMDGKNLGQRHLRVRRLAAHAQFFAGCDLAFLTGADADAVPLRALGDAGVLTVADDDAAHADAGISLLRFGRQLRFEVNSDAAARAGVVFSSKLLRLATDVR
ncbi:MAG: YfiR family protein [Alphaproteobacteria bacterium]|nr:MAG: YfiR family protein [Alphaproteobacteria bacterium]